MTTSHTTEGHVDDKRDPNIRGAYEQVAKILDSIAEETRTLEQLLAPILRPEGPQTADPVTQVEAREMTCSPHASELLGLRYRCEFIYRTVNDLLHRVDL